MKYKLVKKKVGTQELSDVIEFENSLEIRDIHFCNKNGIFFSAGDFVGKIDLSNNILFPYLGATEDSNINRGEISQVKLNAPCSFYSDNRNDTLYISENGGELIRLFNLNEQYLSPMMEGVHEKDYLSFFVRRKIENLKSFIFSNGVETFWTVPSLNRIFAYKDCILRLVAGNGRAGFTTSNNIENCQFSSPQGIIVIGRNVYVADTGNNCIRVINDKVELFSGFPLRKDFDAPSKMVERNGVIFVLDRNGLKSIGLKDPQKIVVVYDSTNIVSMTVAEDKSLMILEKNGY
jgi:hypothetical protein